MSKPTLVIHGGAGTMTRQSMTPQKEANYHQALNTALLKGWDILSAGGSALDAVEQAVKTLEDDPLFNAGRGSVFNYAGYQEMEASMMCGATLKVGAATGLRRIKNPIALARKILDTHPQHIFLYGTYAEDYAKEQQVEWVEKEYFFDVDRYQQWRDAQKAGQVQLDHSGTVGAVALDINGNLAAATSTGGMTNKSEGRIGDTPLIGAGTYANNQTCAVSCTGHGEYMIRTLAAHTVSCLMAYGEHSLESACHTVVFKDLLALGGEGGLIAIDRLGNIACPFNSEGMYRAWIQDGESGHTAIY